MFGISQVDRHRLFPWVLAVTGCLLIMVVTGTTTYSLPVYFKPIAHEFGWSASAVSAAFSARWFTAAAVMVFSGWLTDRFGSRRSLLVSYVGLAVGLLLSSQISSLWELYLFQGVVMGAASATPLIALVAVVTRWFDRKRGLALGILTSGTGFGSIFFPPLAASLVSSVGWRAGYVALGVIALVIGVAGSIIVKDVEEQSPSRAKSRGGGADAERRDGPERDAMRSRELWTLVSALLLLNLAVQLVMGHLVNYATDRGTSLQTAAAVMSVIGIGSTIGRFAMGAFSDRLGSHLVMTFAMATCAVGIVGLNLFVESSPIWVFAFLFGLGYGGEVPLIPSLLAKFFGIGRIATLTSVALIGVSIGGGLGPWTGGYLHDVTGGYPISFAVSAAAAFFGFLILWRVRAPRQSIAVPDESS